MAEPEPHDAGTPAVEKIDHYTLVRRLARGGMAEVHLAHERGPAGIERFVALKLILPHMADEASFVRMFLHEARVAATLDHPNIAQVLAAGEYQGEPYIVMEYVHGETVHRLLGEAAESEDGTLPPSAALEVVVRACSGLHYAHERCGVDGQPLNIVHRDVSPSNLMVRFDGTVKLLDFGIAKAASQTSATAAGVFKGKSGYMSPEQCADEPIDRRSDIFNLGILLYELTTLHRTFFGDNPVAIINKIVHSRYMPPSQVVPGYPAELEAIVQKALAVDPDDRYATALELQLALESFAVKQRLTVSPSQLASFMKTCLGSRRYPSVADIPPVPTEVAPPPSETGFPSTLVATDPAFEPPRRPGVWAVAAAMAAVLGSAAWFVLSPEPATPAQTNPIAPELPLEPASEDAKTPTREPLVKAEPFPESEPPAPEPEPAPRPAPEPEEDQSAPMPEPATETAPARPSKKRKPRRKPRRKKKRKPTEAERRESELVEKGFYPS